MGWQDGKEKNMQGEMQPSPSIYALEARTREPIAAELYLTGGGGRRYLLWGLQARFLGLQHTPASQLL